MSVNMYQADKDIHQIMRDLVGQYHPDLAMVVDEIGIIFREKAGKSGGQVVLGRPKKASPLINVLGSKGTPDFKFILELGADVWESDLDSRQRKALLDHLLCACRCEEDPKSGEIKCYIAPPDFVGYKDEIERWGMWRPKDEDDGPSAVEEMFKKGKDED